MNRIAAADDGNGKARYKVVSARIFDDTIDLGGESVHQAPRALRMIISPLTDPSIESIHNRSRAQFGTPLLSFILPKLRGLRSNRSQ
jgi:hypothetical protein